MANETRTTDKQPDDYATLKAKAVKERKERSRELQPVKNDPMAATSTKDFVSKVRTVETDEAEDEAPARVKESPEDVIKRKNEEAEAKRQALKTTPPTKK